MTARDAGPGFEHQTIRGVGLESLFVLSQGARRRRAEFLPVTGLGRSEGRPTRAHPNATRAHDGVVQRALWRV